MRVEAWLAWARHPCTGYRVPANFSFAVVAGTIAGMESIDVERRREAWSTYWEAGGLHSCIGRLVEDREGAIGRFWRACFAGLRDGDRMLDLATGNGALLKFMRDDVARDVRVDAVDLADVAPQWLSPDATTGITFHRRVRMEALPFADATFDLVVSQFGLEYAQWPQALDEAARVCGNRGRLAFVLHHADSLVVRIGRHEQAHQRFLLAADGLLAVAADLLPHLARVQAGGAPDVAAEQAREAYNAAMRRVAERIGGSEAPDLLGEARDRVHAILGGRFGADPEHRRDQLAAYAQALADASLRTRELLECGLDEGRVLGLVEALRARLPDREVHCRVLAQDLGIVAWGVTAD